MRRHDHVVGALVEQGVTVVPMRFGTTVTEPNALASKVLDAHRASLLATLDELDGLVQYTVRVGYVREAATRAALRDDPRNRVAASASESTTDRCRFASGNVSSPPSIDAARATPIASEASCNRLPSG